MQLKITLSGENISLPLAYSSTIQGFIYNSLTEDSSFAHNLHENGYSFNKRKFKLFTFGEPRGNYNIVEKQLIYRDKLHLEIRSADDYMMQLMYSYFLKKNRVILGDNEVTIDNVTINNKMIFSDQIKVKTLSPITVYTTEDSGHTTYFSPEDEKFYEAVTGNARKKWESYTNDNSRFDFSIMPSENKWSVKRMTRFKDTFITAWHSEFYLKGNIEILNFLYSTGLGSKNSQGFGMFEVI